MPQYKKLQRKNKYEKALPRHRSAIENKEKAS
jgi:hypothetical protein